MTLPTLTICCLSTIFSWVPVGFSPGYRANPIGLCHIFRCVLCSPTWNLPPLPGHASLLPPRSSQNVLLHLPDWQTSTHASTPRSRQLLSDAFSCCLRATWLLLWTVTALHSPVAWHLPCWAALHPLWVSLWSWVIPWPQLTVSGTQQVPHQCLFCRLVVEKRQTGHRSKFLYIWKDF